MANAYKVLGQIDITSANTDTTLYTVPASTSAVVSTITVCNRASSATTFRIAVRPAGAAIASKHYLVYDAAIAANDLLAFTLGLTLATTDVITVRSASTNLTFNAYGTEIT
jgi:glucose-6-phosphate dehydrogenase assembly protein OpcA